jgi:alpha-L-fucosidase
MREIMTTSGPFEGTEKSLEKYTTPEWFRDAKLGIFIHWGIYSVPARVNEWYPKEMYGRPIDWFSPYPANPLVWLLHLIRFGGRKKTGYKDFISKFRGEKFDPVHWAESFNNWGARYVVPVGEHHDGFPMYKTDFTKWNAAEMGPALDVIRELKKEVKEKGMHFGISTHRAWNWSYYRFHKGDDTMNPENSGLYGIPHKANAPESDAFMEDWQGRVKEMIDEFEPEVLYFDFGWHRPRFNHYRKKVAAYYYNKGLEKGFEPVLNYKHQGGASGSAGFNEGSAVLDIERGSSPGIRKYPWQTCTSISYKSWGYIDNDNFRSSEALIRDLIDIVSKNGNLLINIGPRPDGSFPEGALKPLEQLGQWLKMNGEAIYGTRPWRTYGEGPVQLKKKGTRGFSEKAVKYSSRDFRFTAKNKFVYAIQMNPGDSKDILLSSFSSEDKVSDVKSIENSMINWEQTTGGLKLSASSADGTLPRVFCIELE